MVRGGQRRRGEALQEREERRDRRRERHLQVLAETKKRAEKKSGNILGPEQGAQNTMGKTESRKAPGSEGGGPDNHSSVSGR